MKLLVDTADITQIRNLIEYYPIDGVTTNPSILKAAGNSPMKTLIAIRRLIGNERMLHAQVVSTMAEEMFEEALHIAKILEGDTYIKIPATAEGFKAMRMLKEQNLNITATTVFTPMQAFLAAKSGADYVAPYMNLISDTGHDGVETVKTIQDILNNNHFSTKVLAANFKNAWQITEVAAYGVDASTATADIISKMGENPMVDSILNRFTSDFETLAGSGNTMLNF